MTTLFRFALATVLLSTLAAAAGCASTSSTAVASYDFGLASVRAASDTALEGSVAGVEVNAPEWLRGSDITYRLAYQDAARVRVYNNSRWIAAPAELIRKLAQERITATAAGAARSGDAAGSGMGARRYRVELELLEFSQVFRTPDTSAAVVRVDARLFDVGRDVMVAERTFHLERDALRANAQGAVHALSDASEAMLTEVFAWAETQEPMTGGHASSVDDSSAAAPLTASSGTLPSAAEGPRSANRPPARGPAGSSANRPPAHGPAGSSENRPPASGPRGSEANAPVVPPDPQVCAFVVQLELGPLEWASTFDAEPGKVIDKLIALNSGPDVPDNIKQELDRWIREAVRIAYASGDVADDKAKVLFVECAGSRPEQHLGLPDPSLL